LCKELFTEHLALPATAGRGFLCAVSKFKVFAKYWLPVILWAALIFSVSGDKKSVHHSSRLIGPIVRWLIPEISDEALQQTVFVVRKGAHVTEYAVLAMLLWRALRGPNMAGASGWPKKIAMWAWTGAVLFAISDEIHQAYVPGRQGAVMDVFIDSIGAAVGLFSLWQLGRWRKKW
jgi:VanZ family protein